VSRGEIAPSTRADLPGVGALVIAGLVMHLPAVGGWWLWDDPQILAHAQRFSWWEVLTDPAAWRWLSTSNFTPLVTISFQIDLALAGLQPGIFYAHQLLALVLAALALYALLRAFQISPVTATLVSLLFLTSPPAAECARALMTRHYVEGALFFLLSANVWVRSRGVGTLALASLLALVSILAKELFVPCVLGFIVFDWIGGFRGRPLVLRAMWPVGVVGVYSIWRITVLQGFGGYGSGVRTPGYPSAAELVMLLAGPPDAPWWVIWLAGAGLLLWRLRKVPGPALAGAGLLLLVGVLPILPVLRISALRYFFVLSMLGCFLLGLLERAIGRKLLLPVLVLLLMSSSAAGLDRARHTAREGDIWEKEARWFLAGPPEPTLFNRTHTMYLDGLAAVYNRRPKESLWLSPAVAATEADTSVKRFFPDGRSVSATSEELSKVSALDPEEFGVTLERRRGRYQWRAHPPDMDWWYFASPFGEAFAVEAEGSLRFPTGPWPPTRGSRGGSFRFGIRGAGGEWNLTPALPLPSREQEGISWGRLPE
jgi:hypothetical protein